MRCSARLGWRRRGNSGAMATRLRRVDCSSPGITRRGRGRGFEYLDATGERVEDEDTLSRIRELAIPPAWREVWICPHPGGHIQATGIDARGRKQYLYHPTWRERRDRVKFDEMLEFARSLDGLRERVSTALAGEGVTRERVLACAVRLLDRGLFRVGGEEYAEDNESYGLATVRKEHVTINGRTVTFDFPAKSGQRLVRAFEDPEIHDILVTLKRRRGGSDELLAYKRGRAWVDLRSEDINDHVKALTGGDFSAKDFRTWHATVLAAVGLAAASAIAGASATARKRAKAQVVKDVARYLGNTPAVARASYIDPRVFDRFDGGVTIQPALAELVSGDDIGAPGVQPALEAGVLDLISDPEGSQAVEQVA
jgi:DNA topoisomerase-1